MEVLIRDREIERLRAQLLQANPLKRRKVQQNPNERFISLAEILAQANQEPQQRIRITQTAVPEVVAVDEEEGSTESEEEVGTRRSGRNRRPTKRYTERDEDEDKEDE